MCQKTFWRFWVLVQNNVYFTMKFYFSLTSFSLTRTKKGTIYPSRLWWVLLFVYDINYATRGAMAEWLRRGLQILVRRFDSGSRLHFNIFYVKY